MCTMEEAMEEGMMLESSGQFLYGRSVGDLLDPFSH
jgi:hypothetical protein